MKIRYTSYSQIDAFVRLVCLLIKHSGDAQNPGKIWPQYFFEKYLKKIRKFSYNFFFI